MQQVTTYKIFPLSTLQAHLWSLQKEYYNFHVQCSVLLEGELSLTLLHQAFQRLVDNFTYFFQFYSRNANTCTKSY
jgi:hypothetical protein